MASSAVTVNALPTNDADIVVIEHQCKCGFASKCTSDAWQHMHRYQQSSNHRMVSVGTVPTRKDAE